MKHRFCAEEIAVAMEMRTEGATWDAIAGHLGVNMYSLVGAVRNAEEKGYAAYPPATAGRDHVEWQVNELHRLGATLEQAAKCMGYATRDGLSNRLNVLDIRNPWGRVPMQQRWFAETGTGFLDALKKLARHHSKRECARILGYAHHNGLDHYMRMRGIELEFASGQHRRTARQSVLA